MFSNTKFKKIGILLIIGIVSGVVLALFMKIIQIFTGSKAYHLLFDVSYVPLLKSIQPVWLAEGIFHFSTCIGSIVILYELLRLKNWQKNIWGYLIPISVGSAALYTLTLLAEDTPALTDYNSWFYWFIGHLFFSLTAFLLIKKWIRD